MSSPLTVVAIAASASAASAHAPQQPSLVTATKKFEFSWKMRSLSVGNHPPISFAITDVRDEDGIQHHRSLVLHVRCTVKGRLNDETPHFHFSSSLRGGERGGRTNCSFSDSVRIVSEGGPRSCIVTRRWEHTFECAGTKMSHYAISDGDFRSILGLPVEVKMDVVFTWKVASNEDSSNGHNPVLLSEAITVLDGEFSDFVVVCGDRTFPAYKSVLAARSDVFRAMFQNPDCLEMQTGRVEIEEDEGNDDGGIVNPEVVKRFLDLLMSDNLGPDSVVPHEVGVYSLSHKYQVEGLRLLCAPLVAAGVDVSNCADMVRFAKVYDDMVVLAAAEKMFAGNKEVVMATPGWKELAKGSPSVAIDFLAAGYAAPRNLFP